MFQLPPSQPWASTIDLATVRETLVYMHDDMKRAPGLEAVAKAIAAALQEIDAAEKSPRPATPSATAARFVPSWR